MITIELSGKACNTAHTIFVMLDKEYTLLKIDNIPFTLDSKKLFNDLDSYDKYHSPDVSFLERTFMSQFSKYTGNVCIRNMLRAFACSDGYLQFHEADFNSSYQLENKLETAKEHFYNRLLIDWTDKEEPQPQMFFIQKELVNWNLKDIQGLYNIGLLQKYSISLGTKTVETMYVPFEYPDVNNLQIINKYSTWRKIVNGINEEVKRLVNNWSH